jgi:transposase-like protein
MAYPAYVREKARELRVERRLGIVEIVERPGLLKTTVFYWVRRLTERGGSRSQGPWLRGTWRCEHGVLTVTTCDTLLCARLQAWMDCVQETWLHSPDSGA